MAIQKTEKIWHNGKFIPWEDATIHVLSHVVNYGTSVFEGIRCYAPPPGRPSSGARARAAPARFRQVYRMDVGFTAEQLAKAMLEVVARTA